MELAPSGAGDPHTRARRQAYFRLIPLLFLSYVVAYIDRVNIAFAKLTMSKDMPAFDTEVSKITCLVILPPLFALVAQIVVGYNSDRTGERRLHTAVPIAIGALALLLTPLSLGVLPLTMAFLITARTGIKAYQPAFWTRFAFRVSRFAFRVSRFAFRASASLRQRAVVG